MIEKEITHEHYKEALFGRKQLMHKMKILRSEGHEMYGMCMNKISISPFDTKRRIADDGIQTLAYGHFRQLCIRRHNQQLFANKAALGRVRQIIEKGLIWLGLIFNNLVDFQRPDRVCCSFSAAFKLPRLIQISHIDERR